MGVWIETVRNAPYHNGANVTPFVGVWIETFYLLQRYEFSRVTPFVGVWIETTLNVQTGEPSWRHTLRGCVD